MHNNITTFIFSGSSLNILGPIIFGGLNNSLVFEYGRCKTLLSNYLLLCIWLFVQNVSTFLNRDTIKWVNKVLHYIDVVQKLTNWRNYMILSASC